MDLYYAGPGRTRRRGYKRHEGKFLTVPGFNAKHARVVAMSGVRFQREERDIPPSKIKTGRHNGSGSPSRRIIFPYTIRNINASMLIYFLGIYTAFLNPGRLSHYEYLQHFLPLQRKSLRGELRYSKGEDNPPNEIKFLHTFPFKDLQGNDKFVYNRG